MVLAQEVAVRLRQHVRPRTSAARHPGCHSGFKLWRSSALKAIDVASIRSNGYSFQVEMNYRAVKHGLKVVELPIHFAERSAGESKMTLRVQLESALMPFLLWGRG